MWKRMDSTVLLSSFQLLSNKLSTVLTEASFLFFHLFLCAGVTVAAKGYFDALVKLGELASDSQSSKELGKEMLLRKERRKSGE